MGGGGGNSQPVTNPVTTAEVSGDLTGTGWAGNTGPVNFNQPALQTYAGGTVAPQAVYTPGAGVQTGIPQGGVVQGGVIPGYDAQLYVPGGYAAPGIASYFAGPEVPTVAAPVTTGDAPNWDKAIEAEEAALVEQGQAYQETTDQNNAAYANGWQGPGSTVELPDGTQMAVDSGLEYNNAMEIAQTIEGGGINPETGDHWISSGPNALSSADEGLFGEGDYREEFQENFEAQSAHAEDNPYGQSTGTPIYDQGYADPDGLAGVVNNSLIGTGVKALGGNNIVPTLDDLLPPTQEEINAAAVDQAIASTKDDDDGYSFGGQEYDSFHDYVTSTANTQAETDLIQSDLSDDDFWDAYESNDSGSSSSSSSSSSGGGKIVCTAMNDDYGFGSFRNAIWLRYAELNYKDKPEMEKGYHAIFKPLLAMRKKHWFGKNVVYPILKHIARHRSADLRAEMKGNKRDRIGQAWRFVLEPLCYIVGRFVK